MTSGWAAALFMLAAGLRLPHLDHGLRHEPIYDERVFVDNAFGMMARQDWDHRFYEYPGLLLWILRCLFTATGAQGGEAFWWARAFLAMAAAAAVPLVFLFVSRWMSIRTGLMVALMLAFSPVDVETVRLFRPDTILGPLLFLALALDSPGRGEGSPWPAWWLATVATALKFSAALIFAPLLLTALLRRTPPWRIAAMCLASLVLFAVLSPYTFLAGTDSIAGMRTQIDYHYGPDISSSRYVSMLTRLLGDTAVRALSVPAFALAGWGALLGLRRRSLWMASWTLFPILWILVFSSTGIRRDRFIVPVLASLCVLAAVGLEDLFERSRALALATAALAVLLPAVSVERYLSSLATPPAMDQALDWIERGPGDWRVATTIPEFATLEAGGPEIMRLRGFHGEAFLASQFDALVMPATSPAPGGFVQAARFGPAPLYDDLDVVIFRSGKHPRFSALDLGQARVVSSAPERDSRLKDGELSTRWGAQTSSAFITITWPEPVTPSRLEVAFGRMPPPRDLRLTLSDDGGKIEAEPLRPPLREQKGEAQGFSQLLAWPGRATRTLRLDLEGPRPLRIGELLVFAEAEGEAPAKPEPRQ